MKRFMTAIILLSLTACNSAHASEFELLNVGSPDTEIPGGTGKFDSFSLPGISDGWVVFVGLGQNQTGVYRRRISDPASLEVIADTNTPIPGGTGNFTDFGLSASVDHGDITFRGSGGPPGAEEHGIYTYIGGILGVVADKNTPVPGGTGTFSDVGVPWICHFEGGTVVFKGHGTNGERGVYTNAGGVLRVVADLNTAIPEGVGTFTRFQKNDTFIRSAIPTMEGGNVAFYGEGINGQQGIYLEWNGSLSKVADLNTPIPGGIGNFPSLGGHIPAQIEGDTVVFANLDNGLYRSENGVLSLIVDLNTPVPSSAPGVVFNNMAAQGFGLSNGAVSFLATVTGNTTGNIYTTLGGSLTTVIVKDDIVDGVALTGFGTYGNGLDGDSIVFNAGIVGTVNSTNYVARMVNTTTPVVVDGGGSSSGCSLTTLSTAFDPTFLLLLFGSALYLVRRQPKTGCRR